MSLNNGQQVTAEALQNTLTVKQKLGEGGQGTVYQVEDAHGTYALKWYNTAQATDEQRQAIHTLVQSGPPRGPAGRRFVWLLSLVTAADTTLFGYLMPLIDTQRFATLDEVKARLKPRPDYPTLCDISAHIANSYRTLHLAGYCYRDLNAGNLMFDPGTGEILICDNDNVGINRQSQCQVLGTMEFMAPEIVLGEADPSTESDLYSLAGLLFHLWFWHHPLHGELEYNVRCWDLPAKRHMYGERPVFLFDPHDASNRPPNDPDYGGVQRLWQQCPQRGYATSSPTPLPSACATRPVGSPRGSGSACSGSSGTGRFPARPVRRKTSGSQTRRLSPVGTVPARFPCHQNCSAVTLMAPTPKCS